MTLKGKKIFLFLSSICDHAKDLINKFLTITFLQISKCGWLDMVPGIE